MRVRAVGDGGVGRSSRILARPALLVAVQASKAVLWAGRGPGAGAARRRRSYSRQTVSRRRRIGSRWVIGG